MNAIPFFVQHSVLQARRMAMPEARQYLRGLLELAGTTELPDVRQAYAHLAECDAQLELISSGQMRMKFNTKETEGTK